MTRSPRLQGRHALLTGAGGGIGLAVAEAYLAEGARCTAVDLAATPSAGLAELLARHPEQLAYASADVAQVDTLGALVDAAAQRLGTVDVLFNNAAVFDMAPLLEADERMYQRLFDVNVKGMFFVMQAVLSRLVATGRPGSIVNLASQAGRRGEALVTVYCATKAAVISITQSTALGLIKHGINVNAIAPGVVDTPMWDQVDALFAKYENRPLGEKKRLVGEAVPAGRMGTPDDYRGIALFLASADSDYVVAQTYNVDGGNWMS